MRAACSLLGGVAALLSAAPAGAEPVTLDLPGPVERLSAAYRCSDGVARDVTYVNLPEDSLAIVPVGGAHRLFVSTLAASGVRYQSGALVWWTKGREATWTDETRGDQPPVTCEETDKAQ